MEEAPPIICETDKPKEVDNEINFIEEIKFKQDNEEYNIKFGAKENDLIIKVVSESLKEIIHYQKYISLYNIQKIPLFSGYNNVNDIIKVLKGLKFEIEKKNNEITIFFFFYMPNGKSKFIRFNLPRYIDFIGILPPSILAPFSSSAAPKIVINYNIPTLIFVLLSKAPNLKIY